MNRVYVQEFTLQPYETTWISHNLDSKHVIVEAMNPEYQENFGDLVISNHTDNGFIVMNSRLYKTLKFGISVLKPSDSQKKSTFTGAESLSELLLKKQEELLVAYGTPEYEHGEITDILKEINKLKSQIQNETIKNQQINGLKELIAKKQREVFDPVVKVGSPEYVSGSIFNRLKEIDLIRDEITRLEGAAPENSKIDELAKEILFKLLGSGLKQQIPKQLMESYLTETAPQLSYKIARKMMLESKKVKKD